jgi:hypothetical protein
MPPMNLRRSTILRTSVAERFDRRQEASSPAQSRPGFSEAFYCLEGAGLTTFRRAEPQNDPGVLTYQSDSQKIRASSWTLWKCLEQCCDGELLLREREKAGGHAARSSFACLRRPSATAARKGATFGNNVRMLLDGHHSAGRTDL